MPNPKKLFALKGLTLVDKAQRPSDLSLVPTLEIKDDHDKWVVTTFYLHITEVLLNATALMQIANQ